MSGGDLLFDLRDGVAVVTLNRPEAMNALTLDMTLALHRCFEGWASDNAVAAVVVRGAGDRAFCAGGDIRALYDAHRIGGTLTHEFFQAEYRLNRLFFHYPKPVIALMDGVTMGGGVGLSVHASTRIVSDRTMFAMPETGIGLFPDVGGSYFLPRLPGAIGLYLALTGARLRAADCLYAGIADAFIASAGHDEFVAAIRAGEPIDDATRRLAQAPEPAALAENRDAIDRCFHHDRVEDIELALQREESAWAKKTLKIMATKSPTSQKITRRQLCDGAKLDFDACMVMEYRLSQHIMAADDFFEGVRALIIDKDNTPQWRPGTLAAVDETMVNGYFEPLGAAELTFS
jgi:enoyl-CoA hydratase